MAVLHHLATTPSEIDLWRMFVAALAPGDTVILLDRAVAAATEIAAASRIDPRCRQVRWLVPAVELEVADAAPLPVGLAAISDEQWCALIANLDVVLEWN